MTTMTAISVVLIGLLIFGFLIGLVRSWKKSLIRFSIIVGCILLSILLTNIGSNLIMSSYVNGLVINLFGLSVNFEEMVFEMIGDTTVVSELLGPESVTTKVATALMNVVVNLISFIVIFVILFVISLIIYEIVSIIVTIKKKSNPEKIKPVKVWERFIGAGIGVVGILLFCMVIFTPVFGIMNICDGFIEKDTKNTANAINYSSYMSAGLYNNTNNKIEKVESYIDDYIQIKEEYENSFAGIVFKYTGIDFIGRSAFNSLSSVKVQGLKFNFVDESVSIIKFYNQYKKTFVKSTFDITKTECVNNSKDLYTITTDSEVLRSYVVELVPKFATKWKSDEKCLGIDFPINGRLRDISKIVLNVFETTSYNQIDQNINIVFEMVGEANKNRAIEYYKAGVPLENIVTVSDDFVKNEILIMTQSAKFRAEMPKMMTEMFKLEYKKMIGDPGDKFVVPEVDAEKVDWVKEADIMQIITNNMVKVYLETKNDNSSKIIRENLTEIGIAIDAGRKSAVISESFKQFMVDYINSNKFNMKQSVKTYAIDLINSNWYDENYKFEDSFAALEKTSKMTENLANMDLELVKQELKNIIKDKESKEALKKALQNGVLADTAGGTSTNSKVMSELLLSFMEIDSDSTNTSEEVDKAVVSSNEITDLVNASQTEEKTFEFEGETEEEKKQDATEMMENIASSKVVMNAINKEDSEIAKSIDELSIDEATTEYGIENADISEEDKEILRKFFNLK